MADERKQNDNDSVKDLLARLRSQMSQMDEMFGAGAATDLSDVQNAAESPVSDAPSVSADTAELSVPDTPAEDPAEQPDADEMFTAEEQQEEEAFSEKSFWDVAQETAALDTPPSQDTEQAPSETLDRDTQAQENSAFDTEPLEENEEQETREDALSGAEDSDDGDERDEDETLVFSRLDACETHFEKESVVAGVRLVTALPEKPQGVITEGEYPAPPAEKTESRASFFIPTTPAVEPERTEKIPSAKLWFPAQDTAFDPAPYDAVIHSYEEAEAPASHEDAQVSEPSSAEDASASENAFLDEETEKEQDTSLADSTQEVALPPTLSSQEDDKTQEEQKEILDACAVQSASVPDQTPSLAEETTEEELAQEEPSAKETAKKDSSAPNGHPVQESIPVDDLPPLPVTPHARIVVAEADLSETDRGGAHKNLGGRVHLAPKAYRSRASISVDRDPPDEEEDYIGGLPQGIREQLSGAPLGRPNRAQGSIVASQEPMKSTKKLRGASYRFPEETEAAYDESGASDYIRHHLKEEVRASRIRLIVIAAFALLLLILENITRVLPAVPTYFVVPKTQGIIDALLLLGAVIAAWPRLYVGALGIWHRRILPESIVLLQVVFAFVYAAVFGILGTNIVYFSFVPALGLALLYFFRTMHCETRLRAFSQLTTAGEKLVFAPTEKSEMHAEIHALGKSLDGEAPLVYRVRKTSFTDGFVRRSTAICEDEKLNFGILLACLAVSLVCGVIAFFAGGYSPAFGAEGALLAFSLSAPLLMCGAHIYPVFRTAEAATENSAVIGEETVHEATRVAAVCFEDIEAAPSAGVLLSGIQVHCDDPTTVFRYLTALYNHIGGPLCGRFSGMYEHIGTPATAAVSLVNATKDGVSAVVDGAELVVGNGAYMVANDIIPAYDASDEKVLSDGKKGILYVAVNSMICMKFYMEHRISAAFEKNVMRMHRLGIATILRTYDPNFNDKTLARSSSLTDCRVHVVGKKAEQLNDFYASHCEAGLVTSGSSADLIKLLLLCFRTKSALRFGWLLKLAGAALGGITAVLLTLLGAHRVLPSVYPALYQLILLFVSLIVTRIRVGKLPEISEK